MFSKLEAGGDIHAVVLAGRGNVFCAGADLSWMRESATYTHEQNLADAQALAAMLATINACELPVIARVQRAAFGGAIGLLACCDTVICTDDCRFAFSEVRLGISPATIAPYVIAKTGPGPARDLFLSGERFDAPRALQAGLVHRSVVTDELDEAIEAKLGELALAGPQAIKATKQLILRLGLSVDSAVQSETAELIARLRVSEEGQEGLTAFLEKRRPGWTD